MPRQQGVHTVDVATGISVAFAEHGDRSKPAVLLLHAWAESSRCFDRLTPLLPPSFHVLAMDQRGHGNTDRPTDGYDVESLGKDVEAFMDAVGLPHAVLVGSSSGGYVAQQVAIRSPDHVAGLVLIGAPRSLRHRPPFADEVDCLTDPVDPVWVRESFSWFPRFHEVPDWYIEDRVDEAARMPANVWQSSLAGLTTSPAPTDAGTIAASTLIVWGDRDELLTRADQQALAAKIPNSRLLIYEGVGHLVLWEQPERVAADVTRFVYDVKARRRDGPAHLRNR